jgi:hypothetical protein
VVVVVGGSVVVVVGGGEVVVVVVVSSVAGLAGSWAMPVVHAVSNRVNAARRIANLDIEGGW